MYARIIGLVLSGLLAAPAGHAGFELTGEARAWCKDKTLDYLRDRGYTPYNWTASTYVKNNDYVTEGVWRVDVDDIKVECVSKKDNKRASGKFKILNIEIIDGGNAAKRPAATGQSQR